jgi:ABC-type multidrug transport system ATPase subunit
MMSTPSISPLTRAYTSAVEVEGLTKSFGDFTAVQDLTFSALPGEVLGIVGSNGAGKNTLLRALTGIIRPTRATILV